MREECWEDWNGCYRGNPRDLIVPEAFVHPAKFSPTLLDRIYEYGFEEGFWKVGDVIGDPFGGIGLGGIVASYKGLRWIGVELEERFVDLANRSFEKNRGLWRRGGLPEPIMIRGDSREFSRLVREALVGIASSPPYNLPMSQDHPGTKGGRRGEKPSEKGAFARYGKTKGQIEGLPQGELDGGVESSRRPAKSQASQQQDPSCESPHVREDSVEGAVSSPPYSETLQRWGGSRSRVQAQSYKSKENTDGDGYGRSEGQIGRLPVGEITGSVGSPPYGNRVVEKRDLGKPGFTQGSTQGQHAFDSYGEGDENIGNLPMGEIKGGVSSPPYGNITTGAGGFNTQPSRNGKTDQGGRDPNSPSQQSGGKYSDSNKNIANLSVGVGRDAGETYWIAVEKVYRELWRSLRVGGVVALVVKDYVRNWERIPLCDDTARLLCKIGFDVFLRVRAHLVEERKIEGFLGEVTFKKAKKSFFRREAERRGAPPIDWEEVIWAKKGA